MQQENRVRAFLYAWRYVLSYMICLIKPYRGAFLTLTLFKFGVGCDCFNGGNRKCRLLFFYPVLSLPFSSEITRGVQAFFLRVKDPRGRAVREERRNK